MATSDSDTRRRPTRSRPPSSGVLALANGYRPDQLHSAQLGAQAIPTVLAVLIGYGLWRVVREFANAEVQAADAQHDAFSAWLHSELLGSVAALRRRAATGSDDQLLAGVLDELDGSIRAARHRLTLGHDSVAMADVVSTRCAGSATWSP